jgi:single-strand selective monofunctional uracil DNA glycosylase
MTAEDSGAGIGSDRRRGVRPPSLLDSPPMSLVDIDRRLAEAVDGLQFAPPVAAVYNPLAYARAPHEAFLARYARPGVEAVWLGMNPGPWGMAQTGVPFGEVAHVRDWMGIEAPVEQPAEPHPKRPIEGFACARSEVSGRRLWGWAAGRYPSADAFFDRFFVLNYCPLVFMAESGRNITPDKLPAAERAPLFATCDAALREAIAWLKPRMVVGVGRFATDRGKATLAEAFPELEFGTVLHPSPASPAANRGWEPQAEKQLAELGLLT